MRTSEPAHFMPARVGCEMRIPLIKHNTPSHLPDHHERMCTGKPASTWRGNSLAKQDFPNLNPLPPAKRESRSAAQARLTAHLPPPTPHHWSDHDNLLAAQVVISRSRAPLLPELPREIPAQSFPPTPSCFRPIGLSVPFLEKPVSP